GAEPLARAELAVEEALALLEHGRELHGARLDLRLPEAARVLRELAGVERLGLLLRVLAQPALALLVGAQPHEGPLDGGERARRRGRRRGRSAARRDGEQRREQRPRPYRQQWIGCGVEQGASVPPLMMMACERPTPHGFHSMVVPVWC